MIFFTHIFSLSKHSTRTRAWNSRDSDGFLTNRTYSTSINRDDIALILTRLQLDGSEAALALMNKVFIKNIKTCIPEVII